MSQRKRILMLGAGAWAGAPVKARLLAQASVCVLPSYAEGLPMSVPEAMPAGLAVIATPVGGVPDLVTDGIERRLVPPRDIGALAAALGGVLSDTEARRSMGIAGRTKAENVFSSSRIVPLIESIYRQLGAGAPRHAATSCLR